MKKYLFITLFLLFSLIIKAQNSVLQLPDSVGKYLFELFINDVDITHSKVTCIETDFSSPKDMWAILLKKKDEFNLNPQTTKYYNTFYEQEGSLLQHGPYEQNLYVSMTTEDKIYAFRAKAQWVDNGWIIGMIDSDLYVYSGILDGGFQNVTSDNDTDSDYDGFAVVDSVAAVDTVAYQGDESEKITDFIFNKNFRSTVDILNTQTLTTPESFSKRVLKLLTEGTSYGNDEIFLTRQEYLDTEGARIITMLEKMLKSEEYSNDEEVLAIYNNPGLLYDMEVSSWEMLPTNLKEEFGVLEGLVIQDIIASVSNWNREKEDIDVSTVSATIQIPLHYDGKDAGIYLIAIWYNGMWKLSHIQGVPYGISSVEAIGEDAIVEPEQ